MRTASPQADLPASALLLGRAFFAFAGIRGWRAIGLVVLGAVLDGASLALLVPILDLVVSGAGSGVVGGVAEGLFARFEIDSALGRLSVLVGAFITAMVVRGIVLYRRDIELNWLQIHFVGAQRTAVFRDLAETSWGRLSELRHARLINLMSGDIQRVAVAVQVALQGSVALLILLAQGALALALSPPLTLAVCGLIALAALIIWPSLIAVHRSGAQASDASLALMSDAGSFLGGLKASIAQNTQAQFLARVETSQARLIDRHQAFVRRQALTRLVLTVTAGLVAAAVILVGFTILGVAPAVLITLVIIYSRMAGPVMTLQQSVQQSPSAYPRSKRSRVCARNLSPRRARTLPQPCATSPSCSMA